MTLPNDDSRMPLESHMRGEALNWAHDMMVQRKVYTKAHGNALDQYLYIFEKTIKELRRTRSDMDDIVREADEKARKKYDETFRTVYDTAFYEAFDVGFKKAVAAYESDESDARKNDASN